MFRRYRTSISMLCFVLLIWQTGFAPLVHAAAFHGTAAEESVLYPAAAHSSGHDEAAASESVPCHGDHDSADSAGDSTPGTPDCCQSLACQCACLHASLSLISFFVPARVFPDHPAELGPAIPPIRARVSEFFRPPI